MQKSRKKNKGFTLTELAIVIAVIAILIAVLVPTFVSLINSAKLSADEQATKNMNTALATDEAINGKPSNLAEAQEVLETAGFSAELIPTTNGYYYYWSSEYNIVMLIDTSDSEWNLVYPTTDDAGNAYTAYKSSCYNLKASKTTGVQDGILALVEAGGSKNKISVASTTTYTTGETVENYGIAEIVTLANDYGETFEGAVIELADDIASYKADPIANFQGTFEGNNKTITVSANGIVPVYGDNGNGYLYSNVYDEGDGRQQYKYSYGLFGSVTNGGIVENVTITYADTSAPADPENEYTYFGGIVGCLDGGTISNCIVSGTIIQYNRIGGIAGNVLDGTIGNCTVTANIQSVKVGKTTYVDSKGNAVHTLTDYSYAGGIIAYAGNKDTNNGSITITDCTVGGDTAITIQSQGCVGGIIAWVSKGINPVTISDTQLKNVTVQKNDDAAPQVGAVIGCVGSEVTLNGNVTCTNVTVTGHSNAKNYWYLSTTGTNVTPTYDNSNGYSSGLLVIGRDAKAIKDANGNTTSYTKYVTTMNMTVTWTTSN